MGLSFRVTPELKRKLAEAAAKSGRGQSQEAEFRLEQSFREDRLDMLEEEIKRQDERHAALANYIRSVNTEVSGVTKSVAALARLIESPTDKEGKK